MTSNYLLLIRTMSNHSVSPLWFQIVDIVDDSVLSLAFVFIAGRGVSAGAFCALVLCPRGDARCCVVPKPVG
jgi:hypothetical protein